MIMDNEELKNNSEEQDKNEEFELNDNFDGGTPTEGTGDVVRLSGMYQDWFLDYASYVILERAVPHLYDGLKPVQRRILHSMRRLEDGRYNKVANIIGNTMQFHPHGDASIGDALVQMGQKDLLIDTQGNWGNTLTGDGAAAPRYIEARLSKFALDVVFNPKTTTWKLSYDGRNKEPVTLPVKFPLLLTTGIEGIAVGLASKVLPHNFNEIIHASMNYLKGKDFELFPDFPTGGLIDVTRYNDGIRGGAVKVRAKIDKLDKKTLVIKDIPFGKNTSTLIESIIKANDKGKIKIRKIDDNTADRVEILLHLGPGVTNDQTIDALYAFTDCEVSISPNSCVIEDDKPKFLGVSEILKIATDKTLELLKLELQIRLGELEESWHLASLEKIFIENEIYEDIKICKTEEEILDAIFNGLKPFVKHLKREVTRDDCVRLSNIPIKRISKYSSFKADEYIRGLEKEMEEVIHHLANIVTYTIDYFKNIQKKHGKGRERKTEIRNFENIEATKVVVANERLYVNRQEGFIGTSLKKDEFVCECSDIDDIIAIRRDGTYVITKVSDKTFIGKDIMHVDVFKKNDKRTIYNVIYRDGLNGSMYIKRCAIKGITRDREYSLTKGETGSRILYLSVNPNGEAEVVKVYLKPRPRLKKPVFDADFSEIAIKGREAQGNILTRYAIHKIVLKTKGESTLGGRKRWFDWEVMRLNADEKGDYLGEFMENDSILAVNKSGSYQLLGFDLYVHFENELMVVEKFNPDKVYSAIYFDKDAGYYYAKRFTFDETDKEQSFIGENPESTLVLLTEEKHPGIEVAYTGKHKSRPNDVIDIEEFIGIKGYKAKGKRVTTYEVGKIREIEPLKSDPEAKDVDPENDDGNNNDDNSQMELNL
jgi:topoisomerase IV subunit A